MNGESKPELEVGAKSCSRLRRKTLENVVDELVTMLWKEFPSRMKRRPKILKKRLIALVQIKVPPRHRPTGRPRQQEISKATEMYSDQKRQQRVAEKPISWIAIAQECVPGFREIRSELRRRHVLRKLRDAVYSRFRLAARKKRSRRLFVPKKDE